MSESSARPSLTAYRPDHPDQDIYFSSLKTVAEEYENHPQLGPGIRLNSDSPNEEDDGEDDLILVKVSNIEGGAVLRKDSDDLKVYTDPNGKDELIFTNQKAVLEPRNTFLPLWVEYTGEIDFKPSLHVGANSSIIDDSLLFHPFDNMVVLISGENQEPSESATDITDATKGIFTQSNLQIGLKGLAVDLIDLGYDVHFIEEPDDDGTYWWDVEDIPLINIFTGESDDHDQLDEDIAPIVDEIQDGYYLRGIKEIAMVGYSHGGGSVYDLSNRIENLTETELSLAFTAYIDAVNNSPGIGPIDASAAEGRRPINTAYHFNAYQPNDFFDGDYNSGEYFGDQADNMPQRVDDLGYEGHGKIDNDITTLNNILAHILEKLPISETTTKQAIQITIGENIDTGQEIDAVQFDFSSSEIINARNNLDGSIQIVTNQGASNLANVKTITFANQECVEVQTLIDTLNQNIPVFQSVFNGNSVNTTPEVYQGVVDFLEYQLIGDAQANIVTGSSANDFLNLLGGDDAANGGAGRDVLDGGTGSNFLTGGEGNDTFYLDGRSGETTWSTITDFNEDSVNIWGWVQNVSQLIMVEASAGATGYQGATYHYDLNKDGLIDTSLTFTGLAVEQMREPSEGVIAENGYLLFI